MIPLTDLRSARYFGYPGGLYPAGGNSRPPEHEKAGIALGATVQPLDADGSQSLSGKVVMLCIGMSNASREFLQFTRLYAADERKRPHLAMIDGARNRANAIVIAEAEGDYWRHVDRQLLRGQVTANQVQVVWLKTALSHRSPGFRQNTRLLHRSLSKIVDIVKARFPQLKLVYLSSRTYGGYSDSDLSPEPMAYQSGFAVKWLIEERLKNPAVAKSDPWVSWGPYLWANGATPRSDGLTWERQDVEADGVHPSPQGAQKVASLLFEFFQNDPTAQGWFLSRPLSSLKLRESLAVNWLQPRARTRPPDTSPRS